ncbi:hypothetical protein PPERSA_07387 [Pseudocohnilembus persalinus]|uniref:VTT domain-containing protein n=1 Tax=Pseudocohnilembus persalinus TaxID=266149 RepID=A0A0V0QAA6_PSEPJ|nr:hypothetical protein PPERSA_07387 [Pseudocohnilembus persalinus]|eukprot:KRW99144.1 hypothetical protein PPERSA_07387 [Pseudocohnilembus persalinus]
MMKELNLDELKQEIGNNKKGKSILMSLFALCLFLFGLLVLFSPNLTEQERIDLFSFAIPGPVFLSILAGPLFGAVPGFILVCLCATTGACFCYGLSYTLGRGIVVDKFPSMLLKFHRKIQANKDNLVFYMLFLRLTPLVPNIIVNIASPIVGIPLKYFAFGTFVGLMPLNLIHLNTGLTLYTIEKLGANLSNILWIAVLGLLALIPTLFKKQIEKFDEKHTKEAELKQKKENKKDL